MEAFENNAYFWQKVDTLYFSNKLIITNVKGSSHPVYSELIYPCDYGFLESTNGESTNIHVYKGSLNDDINTIILAVDILNKELDAKLLVGTSLEEEKNILAFLNNEDFQKTIVVRRGNDIPFWAVNE